MAMPVGPTSMMMVMMVMWKNKQDAVLRTALRARTKTIVNNAAAALDVGHIVMLLPSVLTTWFIPLIALLPDSSLFYDYASSSGTRDRLLDSRSSLRFELRHLHAVSPTTARVVFADVGPASSEGQSTGKEDVTSYTLQTLSIKSFRRPRRAARLSTIVTDDWEEKQILGPDVERRETLLQLAKMSNNAYVMPNDSAWYDLGNSWTPVIKNDYPHCPTIEDYSIDVSSRLETR
jgi:hypothetical protein